MNISDMQKHIKAFSIEKGFDTSTVEQRALFLMTEVGEMVRELLHLSYHPDHENKEEITKNLGLEMYDIVWNLCDLANKLEIDLEKSFAMKMEINKDRTW